MGATIYSLIVLSLLFTVCSFFLFILFVHSPFVVAKISHTTYCKTCLTLTKLILLKACVTIKVFYLFQKSDLHFCLPTSAYTQ